MWHTPAAASWKKCPSTLTITLLAAGLSLLWWCGTDLSFLLCNFEVSQGQIYRLLTGTFLQADIFQLAFSCFWFFVLGIQVERAFGSFRFLAIFLFFAVTVSATDYALSLGSLGLTGVVFGLFALIRILQQKDRRFAGSIGRSTIVLFAASFLVCFIPHLAPMPEALRHSRSSLIAGSCAGAIAGALLGATLTGNPYRRYWIGSLTATFCIACLFAAFLLRPAINFQADLGSEFATLGRRALDANRFDLAAEYFREAIERNDQEAAYWYDHAEALTGMGQIEAAASVVDQAMELDPEQQARKQMAMEIAALGLRDLEAKRFDRAAEHYRDAIDVDSGEANYWYNLATAYSRTGKFDSALPMFDQAVRLDPDDSEYKKARAWCKSMAKKAREKNEKGSGPAKP